MHAWVWLQCLGKVLMGSKSQNVLFCIYSISLSFFLFFYSIQTFIIIHDFCCHWQMGSRRSSRRCMRSSFLLLWSSSFTCCNPKSHMKIENTHHYKLYCRFDSPPNQKYLTDPEKFTKDWVILQTFQFLRASKPHKSRKIVKTLTQKNKSTMQ